MDDSIIAFLFIFAFFILPSILKQVKAAKSTKAKAETVKQNRKKPSIFDKINEKIQIFVQELEQQAKQQKKAGENQPSLWEAVAEGKSSSQKFEIIDQGDDYFTKTGPLIPENEVTARPAAIKKYDRAVRKKAVKETSIENEPLMPSPGVENYTFKSNPLQNAVIWSEILGKPVGLRE
jgi:hypothetical protein